MKEQCNVRKWINTLHLWIGISSGLILFVVCLSGTIYVFNREIIQWVDSDKFKVTITADRQTLPMAQLIARIEKEKPGFLIASIQIPEDSAKAWTFTLSPQEASSPRGMRDSSAGSQGNERERLKSWLVDPYTGHIQGDAQSATSRFFNTILQLHRWLLMKHEIGKVITGIASLLFIVLEITGLLLWLPARMRSWKKWTSWKPGFTIKKSSNWKRRNHDLHKTLGFYTFLVITIMALTGPVIAFDWYRTVFSKALGVTPAKKDGRTPNYGKPNHPNTPPLNPDSVNRIANALLPWSGDMRINFPARQSGSTSNNSSGRSAGNSSGSSSPIITVFKGHTGAIASIAIDRVMIDPYTGEIKKLERYADKKFGEKIVSSVKFIHTGEIFGAFSKIIWFLACLIATSLPITGTLIWINKGRKHQTNRKHQTK